MCSTTKLGCYPFGAKKRKTRQKYKHVKFQKKDRYLQVFTVDTNISINIYKYIYRYIQICADGGWWMRMG